MRWSPSSGSLRPIAIAAMAAWVACGSFSRHASAQFANPVINEFEIAPAGSLEWEILDRLAASHRYDPRDLPRLARMTVLESIAMYENVRADLPQTMIGARIEGEMSILWDSAQLFYLSATPADASSLLRARPLLADVEAAYGRLDASLGAMPGLSQLAAFHLRDVARLLPVMNALIDAMEADILVPAPDTTDPAVLREQSRRLVDELGGLTQALRDAQPAPTGRDALIADLDGLIVYLKDLDRMLAAGPSGREIIESLRLVKARLWPMEARFLQLARSPRLAGRWRQIRQQIDAMSGRFAGPRVIALKQAARPAAGSDRRLLAQADRAITALDAFLAGAGADRTAPPAGLQYQEELGQLRRKLLLFRQQVAAGESPESLARSLREIEDLNRRVGERAQSERRIFRGGIRRDTRGLQAPAQAVEGLRQLLPQPAGNTGASAP